MWRVFPPKDLEKYGAQNTHAPIFFFFNRVVFIRYNLPTEQKIVIFRLLRSISKQVNKRFCIIFYFLYICSINHKFHIQQSILFVL